MRRMLWSLADMRVASSLGSSEALNMSATTTRSVMSLSP